MKWFRRKRVLSKWPGWLAALEAARLELLELNQLTESDFLQVGEKLQRFLDVSTAMSEQCASLVGVLSGAETERGAQDLCSILERARSMGEQASANRLALEQMLEGVRGVSQPLVELNAKMRSFRVMATLIRIEGSRLRQAGVDFETLAEDVRKLASDIEENGKTVLAGSVELREIVARAGAGMAQFEARQRAELPRIQAEAEAGLAALRERRNRASSVTEDMGARYHTLRQEIGALVTSLQFHDITRQQVEHAAAALEQTIPVGEAALLARICRLQRAQLEHARQAFVAAVARVRESLAEISRNVAEMGEQTCAALAGGGDATFLAEMEHGFAGIRTTLAECAESRFSLSTVADAVAEGVGEMLTFVSAIEEIEFRMQRIALNANIKAISIGEQGSALGAVADAIQRLAAESTSQTEMIARGIRTVAEGSERLTEQLAESGEDLTAELERVIKAFHAADGENREKLTEMGASGRSFSQELDALAVAIEADRLLAQVTERSCARLDQVVAAAEPLVRDDSSEHEDIVHNLESQYTMRAERAVHQRAVGESASTEVVETAQLGENVELF